MSLDNFQIPLNMIPELYKNSMVVLDEKQIIPNSLKSETLSFLGGNERQILVLLEDEKNVFIAENDLSFLTDILNACSFSMADIAIVNLRQNRTYSFTDIIDITKPIFMITFGLGSPDIQLPCSTDYFQIEKHQGVTFLNAPSLYAIYNDVSMKKTLWACLKKLFSI